MHRNKNRYFYRRNLQKKDNIRAKPGQPSIPFLSESKGDCCRTRGTVCPCNSSHTTGQDRTSQVVVSSQVECGLKELTPGGGRRGLPCKRRADVQLLLLLTDCIRFWQVSVARSLTVVSHQTYKHNCHGQRGLEGATSSLPTKYRGRHLKVFIPRPVAKVQRSNRSCGRFFYSEMSNVGKKTRCFIL